MARPLMVRMQKLKSTESAPPPPPESPGRSWKETCYSSEQADFLNVCRATGCKSDGRRAVDRDADLSR